MTYDATILDNRMSEDVKTFYTSSELHKEIKRTLESGSKRKTTSMSGEAEIRKNSLPRRFAISIIIISPER